MPNPALVKKSVVKSEPKPITDRDAYAEHNGFTRGECPTSDHSKKVHRARATSRITVTTTWGNGATSRSYIDSCTCRFCGHSWEQEWMPA